MMLVSVTRILRRPQSTFFVFAVIASLWRPFAVAQAAGQITVRGVVHDVAGNLVFGASVTLEQGGLPRPLETKTDAAGAFTFSSVAQGSYVVTAEKSGLHSRAAALTAGSSGDQKQLDLVLNGAVPASAPASAASSSPPMEFADKPNFTVAGITDWTAVGGHGSDSILRTSEDLARQTLTLKAANSSPGAAAPAAGVKPTPAESTLRAALASAPGSFDANHALGEFYFRAGQYTESIPLLLAAWRMDPANRDNETELSLAYQETGNLPQARDHIEKLLATKDNADLRRTLGELDEKMGDPLAAVHEDQQAVQLDPSEQNYFAWGSELLLHRAVWQAAEVFTNGSEAWPHSARMRAALGSALFAGARYEQAAASLCAASDLNPADPEPYLFMGRVEMAAPQPLACIEPRLARFVQQQPGNSVANYLYAMAILKRQKESADPQALRQAEVLLNKAVTIDPRCGDAYLQLGILSFSQRNLEQAVHYYSQAIDVQPQLGEAHYRLAVAYDRMGEAEKARQEFQLHDQIERLQAADVERQRREVKQFLVVLEGQPSPPAR